jgi:hypothetical protein
VWRVISVQSVPNREVTSRMRRSIRPKRATATVESTMHPPFAPMVAVPFVPSFHAPSAGRQAGLSSDVGG